MSVLSDQLVLWVINVLIHSTVLTAVLLCVATLFRRQAAMRYWILCCGLLLVLGSPAVSALIQSRGSSWLALALPDKMAPATTVSTPPQAAPRIEWPTEEMVSSPGNAYVAQAMRDAGSLEQVPKTDAMNKSVVQVELPVEPAIATPEKFRSPMEWLAISVTIATLIWAVGTAFLLLRVTVGWIRLSQILRRAEPITDPGFQAAFSRACALTCCNERRKPRLVTSDEISGPLAAGIFGASVVLPKSLIAQSSSIELADVLIHEVAHVVRRDQIVVLVQNLVAAIYWPHPLVRKLNRELAKAREEVCDNFVLATTDAPIYSRALLSLAQLVQRPETIPGSVGFFASRWKLEQRVAGLLDEARDTQTILSKRGWALVLASTLGLLAGICFGTLTMATAQSAGEESTAKVESNSSEIAIRGIVCEQNGNPIGGAKIWLAVTSFEFNSEVNVENREGLLRELGSADQQGRFDFLLDEATALAIRNRPRFATVQIVATADGHGMDWLPLDVFEDNPTASKERDLLQSRIDEALGDGRFASRVLKLRRDSQPVRGRLVDLEGNRLPNVTVLAESLSQPDIQQLLNALENSWTQGVYEAINATGIIRGLARSELQKVIPPITTDENGEFELHGIGDDQLLTLVFSGDHVDARPVHVLGREMETVKVPHNKQYSGGTMNVFVGRDFTYAVGPSVPVEGIVRDFETGEPVANVLVFVERLFQDDGTQLRLDTRHMRAVTDEQGRFRMNGMSLGSGHVLEAVPPKSVPYLPAPHEVSLGLDDGEAKRIEIQLRRGVWIEGRITDKQSGEPRSAAVDYMALSKNPHSMNVPGQDPKLGLSPVRFNQRYTTDSDGRYRLLGLPGPGVLLVTSLDPGYPLAAGAETIEDYNASGGSIPTTPFPVKVSEWHLLKQINPAADAMAITSDLVLDAGNLISGRVVGPNGQPISDLFVLGVTERDPYWSPKYQEKVRLTDRFTVNGYDGKGPRQLFFKNQDETLVGQYRLEGIAPQEIVVQLEPSVRVTGRLIENATGFPAPRYLLACEECSFIDEKIPPAEFMIRYFYTGNEGRFEITGLMAGLAYKMYALNENNRRNKENNFTIDLSSAKPGETIELGDVPGPDSHEKDLSQSPSSTILPKTAAFGAGTTDVKTTSSPPQVIRGVVLGIDGMPIRDAMVAVVANENTGKSGFATLGFGESRSNEKGEFQIPVAFTDDIYSPRLVARTEESALRVIDVNAKSLDDDYTVELNKAVPLRIRLVDLEGQPAAHLTLEWQYFRNSSARIAAAPPLLQTDANGYVTIDYVADGDGVWLEISGDERFAPQTVAINTDQPEERPERDATYRWLIKKVPAGETVTIALSPAQPFAGKVFLGDSNQPAANAPISIWSSQQPEVGSMVSLDSTTDDQGRFRLNPYPGVRFGIQVYPPPNAAYQSVALRDLRWSSDEKTSAMTIRLPQGVIAEGQITNEVTGEPIAGVYVQYLADTTNPNLTSGFIDGWQAMVRTDAEGRFRVTGLPGSGTLVAHAGKLSPYVMKSMGSREVRLGEPGGTRYYAHAFEKIQLEPSVQDNQAISITLQPSTPLLLRVVDPVGNPVERASYTSVLTGSPHSIVYRGFGEQIIAGTTTVHGLASGVEQRIYIWCEDKKLGAAATLTGGVDSQTVVLHPAGSVTARFVDAADNPIADQPLSRFCGLMFVMTDGPHPFGRKAQGDQLLGDMDFFSNFNRNQQSDEPKTDRNGEVKLSDLIPGAKYQLHYSLNGETGVTEFTVESGQLLDLGKIIADGPEATQ